MLMQEEQRPVVREQADLYLEGFGVPKMPDRLRIVQARGQHAQMDIQLWMDPGETDEVMDRVQWDRPVMLKYRDSRRPLFCGILHRARIYRDRGRLRADLGAYSCSWLLDQEERMRSFQDEGRSKRALAKLILDRYAGGHRWDDHASARPVGRFLMQYRETDWVFLKRLAAMDGHALYADVCIPWPRIDIGLPRGRRLTALIASNSRRICSMEGSRVVMEHIVEGRHEELLLCDKVSFRGMELYITGKDTYLEGGLLYHDYGMRPAECCRVEPVRNMGLTGAMVRGTVARCSGGMASLSLETDMPGEGLASLHPCVVYYKGYSGDPEPGDVEYLYFPDQDEGHRYILCSLADGGSASRMAGRAAEGLARADQKSADGTRHAAALREKVQGPELVPSGDEGAGNLPGWKSWGTPGGQIASLSPQGLCLASGSGASLSLTGAGATLGAGGGITLGSRSVCLRGRRIRVEAARYISMECGESAAAMLPTAVHIRGEDTVIRSPLYVPPTACLPPMEQALRDIEERKAATLPTFAPDGSVIRREGYDDIIDSRELYEHFMEHWYGKGEYENLLGQPDLTVYESWLTAMYGDTTLGKVDDYLFSLEGFQMMISVAGIVYPPLDLVNLGIDVLRGEWGYAVLDIVGMVPMIGDGVKAAYKSACKSTDILSWIGLTYKRADSASDLAWSVSRGLDDLYSALDTGKGLYSAADTASDMGGAYRAAGLIDDVHDGKKVLDAADTLDDIGDASKVLDSVMDGAEAGDITLLSYKGREVSPDLKVEARILDEDGRLVEEISGGVTRLKEGNNAEGSFWKPAGNNNLWNKGKLKSHYEKHGSEFGAISSKEYSDMAVEFGTRRSDDIIQTIHNGYVYRYDPSTNSIFVGTEKGGKVKSFYVWDGREDDLVIDTLRELGLIQ